jgi:hypothetical protein
VTPAPDDTAGGEEFADLLSSCSHIKTLVPAPPFVSDLAEIC